MDDLVVQPVGGFIGAGAPGHVKNEGRIAMSALSPQDREKVEELFAHPKPVFGHFYYRISRSGKGTTRSVDAPVEAVPEALVASVKTTIE